MAKVAATNSTDRFRFLRWFTSLRGRLLLLVLTAVVPAFAIMVYTAVEQRRQAVVETHRQAMQLARIAALEHQQLLAGARQLLISIAQYPSIRTQRDPRRCGEILASLLRQYPYYANLGAALPDGRIFCSGLPLAQPVNIADRAYFREAIRNRDFSVGEFQTGRITGKRSLNLGYPVLDDAGRVQAIVFAAVDLAWLSNLLAHTPVPAGTTLTVVDENRTILARHPDGMSWTGRPLPEGELLRAFAARRGEGTAQAFGLDGVKRFYAFMPLHASSEGALYISLGIPRHVALAAVDEAFTRSLGLLLLVALGVMAVAWVGGDLFVLRRVRALAAAAERLGRGELSARTGIPPGHDEIGQLAANFDTMAAALEEREAALVHSHQELRRVNRALATLSAGNMTLVHAADESMLLHDMCRVAVETGGYRMAWVGFADHDTGKTLRVMARAGHGAGFPDVLMLSSAHDAHGPHPADIALRTGQPFVARYPATEEPRQEAWRVPGIAASLALPLKLDNGEQGVLQICAAEPDAFSEEEIRLLTEMADDLAFGITALRGRTRQRAAEEALRHAAYFDTLTDLPNAVQLKEQLVQAIEEAGSENRSLALLTLDIDRFGEINDALGFEQGDALLRAIGARLAQALHETGTVARLRADEFGILLPAADAPGAERIAQYLLEMMETPFTLSGIPVYARLTLGIALYPGHGTGAEALLRCADVAMRQAKRAGQRYALYARALDQDSARRLALAGELKRAIENGDLVLHYQPKAELPGGRLCGVEALARWPHAQRGMVSPADFVAVAEHTGLIQPLTDQVLETALRQSRLWRRDGRHLPIAVNLSVRNLRDPKLLERIEKLLSTWGAEDGALELEITESAIMEDPVGILEKLHRLKALGIRLYIDDFGTGYSSLAYLKRLPVDAVKIDKTFVLDLPTNQDSALIVRSTIDLAHDLGLKVVAEGVENRDIWDRLVALHCDQAQGYYLSAPLPPERLEDWLASQDTLRVAGLTKHPLSPSRKKQG